MTGRDVLQGSQASGEHGAEDSAEARTAYSLLDLAFDAVFERDFDSDTISSWNRSAEELYGWTAEEALGQSSHVLLRTVFPERLEHIKDKVLRAGRWEGELIHTTRDGRQVVVASRWAVRTKNGEPVSILEVNSNITERRQAEAEQARLAAIVNSSSDAIIGKALDGTITSWNPAAQELYGYAPEEVIGKSVAIIFPPELDGELTRIMERIRSGEAIRHHETIRVRRDGDRVDVSVSVSPIRNRAGRIIGAATIARDITEQKRAEADRAELLERERAARTQAQWAEHRLAFLAEASAILSGSLDYETTLANVAKLAVPHVADWCSVNIVDDGGEVRRLTVAHADPSKVEFAEELERRYPPDLSAPSGAYRVLESGESVLISEITDEMIEAGAQDAEHARLVRTLGLTSMMIVPLVARGRVFGVISLATAESGNHFGKDDLALAEDLARRAGTAVDNARLYRDAQEALRLREEFLSIASHELKTPLTALHLQTQLLRRYVQRSTEGIPVETGARLMDAMERQVKRLTRLTNDLLDVSRIASGRFELERSEVDLAALTREVVDRFAEELAVAGSSVTLRGQDGVTGSWDRHRLDQVVSNLLSNAIKYGRGKPIEVSVEDVDGTAQITIADEGVGISSEDVAIIFNRFERVETVERTGGLGLGLYIVRQILDAHGGMVTVQSEPEHGSRFVVRLPR